MPFPLLPKISKDGDKGASKTKDTRDNPGSYTNKDKKQSKISIRVRQVFRPAPALDRAKPLRLPRTMNQEVAACADLLRRMYELELEIWARTQNISDSADVVLAKQEEANALFEEIYKRVHQWQSMDVAWKDEDKEYLHEICAAMETRARSTTLFPYLVNYGHSDDDT